MYQSKSREELQQLLSKAQSDLGSLIFTSKDPSQTVDGSKMKRLRREIARIKTALNTNHEKSYE